MSIYFKEFELIINTWKKIYNIKKPISKSGASLYAYRHMQRAAKEKLLFDILELFSDGSNIYILPDGKNKIKISSKL